MTKTKDEVLAEYEFKLEIFKANGIETMCTEELIEEMLYITERYSEYYFKGEMEFEEMSPIYDVVDLIHDEISRRADIGTKFLNLIKEVG